MNEEVVYEYKVYKIDSLCHYSGFSLVAAESAKEANDFIRGFKGVDTHNDSNSYGYSFVDEDDALDYVRSSIKGIIDYGIFYIG